MALIMSPPSREARNALLATSRLLQANEIPRSDLDHPHLGFPVYTPDLRQIRNGIEAASRSSSWRSLMRSPAGHAVAIDVSTRSGVTKATGVWRGRSVERALEAAGDVRLLPNVRVGNYELRELRIPGLHLEAFWLKSRSGGHDLFVPFLALSGRLTPMRAYPTPEFLPVIEEMMAERVPPGEPGTE